MTPLVLLHGFAGDLADWNPVRACVGRSPTLVEPLFGHRGRIEDGPGSFDAEVDRLAAAIRAQPFERSHLIGYSLGARLALGLLVRHASLFSSASLIGVQPGLRSAALREERRAADAAWIAALESEGLDVFLDRWQAQPLFSTQARYPERVAARRERLRAVHSAKGLAQAMRALGLGAMPDLWSRLATIDLPVRVIAGAQDAKFASIADEMCAVMTRAERRLIAGAGHNPLFEQPAALAAEFCSSPQGG